MQAAIFLDRDGVIIANRPNYVRNWADVEFFTQALDALAHLKNSSYKIIIITNQSGIGRGLIDPTVAAQINLRLVNEIEKSGGRIDAVYMCPHAPDEKCDCRKPKPGLIFQAARELDLDLGNSILIGDNQTDLQAGQAAGVRRLALVRTGLGSRFALDIAATRLFEAEVYEDLAHALAELSLLPK